MNKILFLGLTEKSRMDSTLLIASPSSEMFNTWVDHACTWKKTVCGFFANAKFDLFELKRKGYRNCFYLAKPFPFDQVSFGKRLCIVNSQHQNKWHLINNYIVFSLVIPCFFNEPHLPLLLKSQAVPSCPYVGTHLLQFEDGDRSLSHTLQKHVHKSGDQFDIGMQTAFISLPFCHGLLQET